jgi:hypothetical protein
LSGWTTSLVKEKISTGFHDRMTWWMEERIKRTNSHKDAFIIQLLWLIALFALFGFAEPENQRRARVCFLFYIFCIFSWCVNLFYCVVFSVLNGTVCFPLRRVLASARLGQGKGGAYHGELIKEGLTLHKAHSARYGGFNAARGARAWMPVSSNKWTCFQYLHNGIMNKSWFPDPWLRLPFPCRECIERVSEEMKGWMI